MLDYSDLCKRVAVRNGRLPLGIRMGKSGPVPLDRNTWQWLIDNCAQTYGRTWWAIERQRRKN